MNKLLLVFVVFIGCIADRKAVSDFGWVNPPDSEEARWPPPFYTTKETTRLPLTEDPTITTQGNRKRISQKKCEEYTSYTYELQCLSLMGCAPERYFKHMTCVPTQGLISNGQIALENEFPHMAHLGGEKDGERKYYCGGTLISESYVLTAAHCKTNYLNQFVRLNSTSEAANGAIYRNVKRFVRHPNYKTQNKPSDYKYDIALIELDHPVQFKKGGLRPACLWTSSDISEKNAIITGWGAEGYGAASFSDKLQKAKLDLVDMSGCVKAFGSHKAHDDYQICARDLSQKGTDTCQGDSGGPIQILQPDNECQMHVLGVVSMGTPCGLQSSIGVYAKVSTFIDWIEDIVWRREKFQLEWQNSAKNRLR